MSLSLRELEEKGIMIIQQIGGEEHIPVAAASILAKSFFEEEVDKMSQVYGIDFRIAKPVDVPKDLQSRVAKLHFRNVAKP